MVFSIMAAIYVRKALPDEITTTEEAEAWACEFARQNRRRVCLVVSRRLSVWIDESGQVQSRTKAKPGQTNEPYMEIAGRRFLLEG